MCVCACVCVYLQKLPSVHLPPPPALVDYPEAWETGQGVMGNCYYNCACVHAYVCTCVWIFSAIISHEGTVGEGGGGGRSVLYKQSGVLMVVVEDEWGGGGEGFQMGFTYFRKAVV